MYKREDEDPTFSELSERAVLREEIAIGVRISGKTVILFLSCPSFPKVDFSLSPLTLLPQPPKIVNPPKDISLKLRQGDGLVVICEFEWSTVR